MSAGVQVLLLTCDNLLPIHLQTFEVNPPFIRSLIDNPFDTFVVENVWVVSLPIPVQVNIPRTMTHQFVYKVRFNSFLF